ncbi:c-type cytochrome [Hymenobacter metallilatus]|uniref:Cytochrome c n=1 Tax=Hymenobacter metallilatus TaxID=2493666 RepID=A0A428JSW6_9BACT|nr:cytochrome c [Hymenobacter metallilatus]RSK37243.1 cytochrome c [Hymenobacter metallilatus]
MTTPVLLLRLHAVVALVVFLFFGYKLLLLLMERREPLRHLRARTRWADSLLLGMLVLSGVLAWVAFPEPFNGWNLFPALLLCLLLLFFVRALRQERAGRASWYLLGALTLYGLAGARALSIPWPRQPNTLRQALLGEAPDAAALATATTPSPAPAGQAETTATPEAAAPVDTAAASVHLSAQDSATLVAAGPGATAEPVETPDLVAGKVLFAQNCAVCHGTNGKLGLNGARDLTKSNLNETGRIYQVTHGSISKKMPAFQGKLTDEQIAQVVAYSLTLR